MQTTLQLQSTYIPKRKTKNVQDWLCYIEAKTREIRYGTHHSILIKK
ncbi:hypothetical protein [Aquimarina sp. 2201CG5-10]|nr:hypothetical protein [Aquimarina sp. 2201CG5-10]MDY8137082.1 hypothetical protein [Aquimarina sp. 2201CG5-10]